MDQGSLKEFSTKNNNEIIRANNVGCELTWQVKEDEVAVEWIWALVCGADIKHI